MRSDGRGEDHELLAALNQLGRELGPFTGGILTNTLSIAEQLDFGWKLINLAERIRARVRDEPFAGGPPGFDGESL